MKITQEADYAIRIIVCLAESSVVTGASSVAECTGVSQRFTLKILRKLLLAGLVVSQKGAAGGYKLSRSASDISLKEIINAVDGDIDINRCLNPDEVCTRISDKTECRVHNALLRVKAVVDRELDKVKIDTLTENKKTN